MDSDRHLIICLLYSILFNQTGAMLWLGLCIVYGVMSVVDCIKALQEKKKNENQQKPIS